jgi:beta-xylosidase/AraC-like DNA-binding protein
VRPNEVVTISFLDERRSLPRHHENPEILFVLEGTLNVTADDREFCLGDEDFLLVNANHPYSYVAVEHLLAVRLEVSSARLYEVLHRSPIVFWCCSLNNEADTGSYDELRQLLKNILFFSVNKSANDEFYANSLYYQLMGLLCNSFLLTDAKGAGEEGVAESRLDAVVSYIQANYRGKISLTEIANELGLSPTYLSKYVRKVSGSSLIELVNQVRLSHALDDLLYTDKSVLRVAMDNGFSSVASFDRVFKDAYGSTPSKYRVSHSTPQESDDVRAQKAVAYLRKYLVGHNEGTGASREDLAIFRETYRPMRLEAIVNAGRASSLLQAVTQAELRRCRDELSIRYVRFWSIFEPDMHFGASSSDGRPNYGRIDEVLDFLLGNGLKPYLVLRSKENRILQTADKAYQDEGLSGSAASLDELDRRYTDFFAHLTRRYGRGEVNSWVFDYPMKTDSQFSGGSKTYRLLDDQSWEEYLCEFDVVAAALRRRAPDAMIGGADVPVQHYGRKALTRFFSRWNEHSQRPNFVSVTSFPYQIVNVDGQSYERRRAHPGFAVDDVEVVRTAMADAGFGLVGLHLAECNLTLSDRSYINDTSMRAAFIASTISKVCDKVDFFGVWNMSDSYSESSDTVSPLFGGSGILTRSGIAKPAFHALSFISRLYREAIVEKGSGLVTKNEHGHYKLLLVNLVNMNVSYYMKNEDQLSPSGLEQMTETEEHRVIHVRISGLKQGWWQVRRYSLSRESGSVLNEWINLDMSLDLRQSELEYLAKVSTPHMYIQKMKSEAGVLEFDVDLEPNEVQYLHVTEYN